MDVLIINVICMLNMVFGLSEHVSSFADFNLIVALFVAII